MTAIRCPKCGHPRQPEATVPDTECPACGVIYAKAQAAPAPREHRPIIYADRPARGGAGLGTWLLLAALVAGGALLAQRKLHASHTPDAVAGADDIDPEASAIPTDALRAFAARVQARDVVMYSTTECVYCGQAKGWLAQNGFAFTECNMSVERRCEDEYRAYGANGTPFLLVRGQQMREGFDVHQFLRILKATDGKA